jgi:dipeptidyl aminopeptidase/acylaminoacyl peptidase
MPLNEHSVHFEVHGQRVWGMLHLPLEVHAPVPAVLILHGFTGQRMEPHRVFVLLSRLLAQNGIASMRFDFRGSGESEGTFDEMTPSREVEDVVAAYHVLRSRPEVDASRLGLLGLSMGGLVAGLSVAQPGLEFRALTLWAPAHPRVWLGPLPHDTPAAHVWAAYQARAGTPEAPGLGFDAETDRLDFSGNPVSQAFFEDLLRLEPFQTVTAHKGPALVVHGTADPTVPIAVGEHYARTLETRGETKFHAIPNGLHTFESLPAQREAHAVTVEFFKAKL